MSDRPSLTQALFTGPPPLDPVIEEEAAPSSWRALQEGYGHTRNQLGSIRSGYLGPDRTIRHRDFSTARGAVVLLQGFMQTRNLWEALEARLRSDGYAVASFKLPGLFGRFNTAPLEESSAFVAEKIDRLLARYKPRAVHLIGHSKGGLIARGVLQLQRTSPDWQANIHSLTTLGTPHLGSPLAGFGARLMSLTFQRTSAAQMTPDSDFLRRVNALPYPPGVPLLSISTSNDPLCPPSSAEAGSFAPNSTHICLPRIAHTELMWHADVYPWIREHLARTE